MCDLLTIAIPKSVDRPAIMQLAEERLKEFSPEPFENQGGSHEYDAVFAVYQLLSGDCSCGVLRKGLRSEIAAFLASAADRFAKVCFIIHSHSAEYVSERFRIFREESLKADDLRAGRKRIQRDVRYTVRGSIPGLRQTDAEQSRSSWLA
jgi:hypothetical protein